MKENKHINNLEEFYELYKSVQYSKETFLNFMEDNSFYYKYSKEIIDLYKTSIKQENSFSKFIKKYHLNLIDLEILSIIKLEFQEKIYKFDIKQIFDRICLFNLREYDYSIFKKYIYTSPLISKKLINLKLYTYDKINKFELSGIKNNYIFNKKEYYYNLNFLNKKLIKNNYPNEYKNLRELELDLKYYNELRFLKIDSKIISNKYIQKNYLKYVLNGIKEKIENSKNTFKIIKKFNLNPYEFLILLKFYFRSLDYDFSNIIEIEISHEDKNKIKEKLIKNNLIKFEKNIFYNELIVSNKLICMLENRTYSKKEKMEDEKKLDNINFLKTIKSKISIDEVHISKQKKELLIRTLSQVKHYDLIFNKWGIENSLEYGKGIIINFYGPSGTGKTMLARGISNYLNKKILEVDFSNLQSKYVGDCEKNISLAFEKAKKEDAILFFDEADSLIIDRAISSHSWEKTQTNVLLQEIEKFNGICIFATNILESYDSAIERRISLNLEFKKPGLKLRRKIFENFLNKKDALDEDVNLDLLAKDYDFSGGEIKNAIMHALRFAASDLENNNQKIKMKHLKYACGIIEKTRFRTNESFNSQIYL